MPYLAESGPFTVTPDEAAHKLTVTSEAPNNALVYAFATAQTGIICPAGLANGADFAKQSFGSGPYTISSVVEGQSVTLKRKDAWKWGPDGATAQQLPKTLKFQVIQNDATAANLLRSGGLDVSRVSGSAGDSLNSVASLVKNSAESVMPHEVIFNSSREPFAGNATLREALLPRSIAKR